MTRFNLFKSLLLVFGIVFLYSCEVLEEENIIPLEEENTSSENATSAANLRTTPARVLINGVPLSYTAAQPYQPAYNDNGTVMVSASAIFSALDWNVGWNQAAQRVTLTKNGTTIYLWINSTIAQVNGTNVTLPKAPVIVNNRTMVPVRFVSEYAGAKVEWDQESQSVQIYYWNKLDYGIYFYDSEPGSEGSWDAVGCQKYVPGQANRFFDPSKPTILYVHGFQLGGVANHNRESFHLNDFGANIHTQNKWKQDGYNVAIFHWVQFADDGFLPPDNVEIKIYSATGGVGMRWKRLDGSFVTHSTTKTMADLFADEYQKVFNSSYSGGRIHVMGNSLGGNLTMAGMVELHERNQPSSRMPQRLTLIDPYWSQNRLYAGSNQLPYGAWDTKDFGGIATEMMYNNYNMAIEYFRTSLAGQQGTSERAVKQAAFIHFGTGFTNVGGTVAKHTVPVRQYMWSKNFAAPTEVSRDFAWQDFTPTGLIAASATTPDWRIRQMMGQNTGNSYKHWNHIEGRDTVNPSDDTFEVRNGHF
ncbi:MAG: copper amine oxidase N-terminal domain-containing protein [Flammeovirgaceae bacterium]